MKILYAELCWVTLVNLCHFTFGAHEFEYHDANQGLVRYSVAVAHCESLGMQLLTTKTLGELKAVETYIDHSGVNNDDIWLGLTLPSNSVDPVDYVWIDGSPLSWTQWGVTSPLEPNFMSTDKCVALQSLDMRWYTRHCDHEHFQCICQIPSTTTTPVLSTKSLHIPSPEPVDLNEKTHACGSYFSARADVRPDGPLLIETWSRSLTDCAQMCLLEPSCDVLYREKAGACQLYSSSDTNLVSETQHATGWKIYIKN